MDYTKKPGQKIETIGKVLNNEKPTISVITPFYNGGKTLMETANALFSQTYRYFECNYIFCGITISETV